LHAWKDLLGAGACIGIEELAAQIIIGLLSAFSVARAA